MSETEVHRGKLVPMVLNGVTTEERAKDACEKLGFELQDFHTSFLDCLHDEGYRTVYRYGGVTYRVEDERLDPYGFTEAAKNKDGSIDYFISYFNGGAGFDEVIDAAMKQLDRKEND